MRSRGLMREKSTVYPLPHKYSMTIDKAEQRTGDNERRHAAERHTQTITAGKENEANRTRCSMPAYRALLDGAHLIADACRCHRDGLRRVRSKANERHVSRRLDSHLSVGNELLDGKRPDDHVDDDDDDDDDGKIAVARR